MKLITKYTALLGVTTCMFVAADGIVEHQAEQEIGFDWNLPKGFPFPIEPRSNPMSPEKVELGRHLFYDSRLSANGKQSCGSCHKQELAFTDGLKQSVGSTGDFHPRSAMGLVNIAYSSALTWNNPKKISLEEQALVPMYGTNPIELGLERGDNLLPRLRSVPKYLDLFSKAFPGKVDPFTIENVCKAIACFERSIISGRSPYDRYHYFREDDAVSASAKRGEELFFSEKFACSHCHGGFNFSSSTETKRTGPREPEFQNTGLYNLQGKFSYPSSNLGIFESTQIASDVGKFKAPTLRNIAVTAPYMHDGSIGTLPEVIDHYAAGGRTINSGPFAGDGSKNQNKDAHIGGFPLSDQNRSDLVAFLESLTDREILSDPKYSNPWMPRK